MDITASSYFPISPASASSWVTPACAVFKFPRGFKSSGKLSAHGLKETQTSRRKGFDDAPVRRITNEEGKVPNAMSQHILFSYLGRTRLLWIRRLRRE
jgi:hypothetical protein